MRDWTLEELADRVTRAGFKVTPAAIGNMESRGKTNPRSIYQIALVFGVTVRWLQTGKGEKMAKETGTDGAAPPDSLQSYVSDGISDVKIDRHPQVSHSSDNANTLEVFAATPGGETGGFLMGVMAVRKVGKPLGIADRDDVFAFQVITSDMAEKYNVGDMVIVERHRVAKASEFVLIELKAEGQPLRPMLLKKMIAMGDDKIRLQQFKPPKEFDVDRSRIEHIYRVMETIDLV